MPLRLPSLRLPSPLQVGTAGLFVLCSLVGLLAGVEPKLALVAAVGLVFALLILVNFSAGLAVFAFLSFLELLDFGSVASVGKLGGGLVVVAWIATMSTRQGETQFFEDHPTISFVIGAFLGWIALGLTWSESHHEVITALTRYIPNALLIPIVYTGVRNRKQALMIIAGIVLGALAASAYGIVHHSSEDARLEGTALDPNELASILVAGVALSAAWIANMRGRPGLRIAGGLAGAFCVLGILLTVSRGGLVALAASLIAAVFLAGRWRPLAFLAAAAIACSSFYYFAVLAPPEATERLELTSQGETQLKEGRTTLWQVAVRIVEDKPITGVGAGNFQNSSRHYLLQPGALGRPDLIIEKPLVVHNTYLGIAAEDGLVGLGLFIVIVLFCIGSAWRAVRYFTAIGDRGGEALARGLTIGLIGIIVADTFISEEYSKVLWLLLGLGPALLGVAKAEMALRRRSEEGEATAGGPPQPALAAQSSR